MAFATDFYDHFPKVGLGHWPPGFYLLQLPWLMLVDDSPASVVLLMALLSALTAGILAMLMSRVFPAPVAVGVGLVWLLMRPTVSLSGAVMTEVPLALVTVLALAAWDVFARHNRRSYALLFGLIVGAGTLVKLPAVALLLIPVAAGHKFAARRSVYVWRALSVIIALAIGVPWTVYFLDVVRKNALYSTFSLDYTLLALPFYSGGVVQSLGWTIALGVVAWIVALISRRGDRLDPLEQASMTAFIGFAIIFAVIPAGFEQRYVLPAVVPLVILSTYGFKRLLARVRAGAWRTGLAAAVIALAIVESVGVHGLPYRDIHGYRQAMERVKRACDSDCVLLVISDANGEGSFVSEAVQLRDKGGAKSAPRHQDSVVQRLGRT